MMEQPTVDKSPELIRRGVRPRNQARARNIGISICVAILVASVILLRYL